MVQGNGARTERGASRSRFLLVADFAREFLDLCSQMAAGFYAGNSAFLIFFVTSQMKKFSQYRMSEQLWCSRVSPVGELESSIETFLFTRSITFKFDTVGFLA